jgi:protein phosphatase PTC7
MPRPWPPLNTFLHSVRRCNRLPRSRPFSTLKHPYRFHVGVSWAGKHTNKQRVANQGWPADSVIGKWRDLVLSRPKALASKDAGEDFFFVQEVWDNVLLRRISLPYFRHNADEEPVGELGSRTLPQSILCLTKGIALGVADGVGGWVESGINPSLFSQALMYHAHRYSRSAWAGEPEVDPSLDYEEREQVEGWELTPYECMDLSYGGVLRERAVLAGALFRYVYKMTAH